MIRMTGDLVIRDILSSIFTSKGCRLSCNDSPHLWGDLVGSGSRSFYGRDPISDLKMCRDPPLTMSSLLKMQASTLSQA